jgi:hypothetical protein
MTAMRGVTGRRSVELHARPRTMPEPKPVRVAPGSTIVQRTPNSAISLPTDSVNPSRPHLAVWYALPPPIRVYSDADQCWSASVGAG